MKGEKKERDRGEISRVGGVLEVAGTLYKVAAC